jgi:hypothetical protein
MNQEEALANLKAMFPETDEEIILDVLAGNNSDFDATLAVLLEMNSAATSANQSPVKSQIEQDEILARALHDKEFSRYVQEQLETENSKMKKKILPRKYMLKLIHHFR